MKYESDCKEILTGLYRQTTGCSEVQIESLPMSGSDRKYYRLQGDGKSVIGVYNPHQKENIAFLDFTRHFLSQGLPVPQIIAEDINNNVYLLSDLGNDTLFSVITGQRKENSFPAGLTGLYKDVITFLPRFQVTGGRDLNYDVCYPRSAFDRQSMLWDLNYFKYYFLKLLNISFDEQALEEDFEIFTGLLTTAGCEHFMYRDFQSRNIMICDGKPYFIDYQGGRKGALQYDIASLLWDAKADIPMQMREILFDHYIEELGKYFQIREDEFRSHYFLFVYIRILQALGAYGFRGFYERKEHFLLSIPYAVANLQWLLENAPLPRQLPSLRQALEGIVNSASLNFALTKSDGLTISLYSFSYKNGIPQDLSGHGGGFVFDCRALPNPGRFPEYASLTGRDQTVIDFFRKEDEAHHFFEHAQNLVGQAVENYLQRGFGRLMVSFGCTGGQHRSVYFAECLQAWLSEKYKVHVNLVHRELEKKNPK